MAIKTSGGWTVAGNEQSWQRTARLCWWLATTSLVSKSRSMASDRLQFQLHIKASHPQSRIPYNLVYKYTPISNQPGCISIRSFQTLDDPFGYKLLTYTKGLASGGSDCLLRVATRLNPSKVSTTNFLDRSTALNLTHNDLVCIIIVGAEDFAVSIAFTTSIGSFREKDSRLSYKLLIYKPDYTVAWPLAPFHANAIMCRLPPATCQFVIFQPHLDTFHHPFTQPIITSNIKTKRETPSKCSFRSVENNMVQRLCYKWHQLLL